MVPHSLVFLPDRRELCVADRENGRIQCFLADSQEFVKEIKKKEFGGRVFAISYRPGGGELPPSSQAEVGADDGLNSGLTGPEEPEQ